MVTRLNDALLRLETSVVRRVRKVNGYLDQIEGMSKQIQEIIAEVGGAEEKSSGTKIIAKNNAIVLEVETAHEITASLRKLEEVIHNNE
ncbi:hypothetical protein MIDIC_500010 [Alphaproteobacteria bacterium]